MMPADCVPPSLEWFWEKYHDAAGQIVEFCEACAVPLDGRDVADVGCGEGSMALGLFRRARPRRLAAYDVKEVDLGELSRRSAAVGEDPRLPEGLEFHCSGPTSVPAEDDSFDIVYSWSAFEHIAEPVAVLQEVRRVLRPGGTFFLQLWPFYFSARGSHLWQWYEQEFHHLLAVERDTVAEVLADDRQPRDWAEYMTHEFERLNRITVSELQRALLAAGLDPVRVDLLTEPVMLTPALARYDWTDLAIGGIKLLARPAPMTGSRRT